MYPPPPIANLLVIRSRDIERAVKFYQRMGIMFARHSHGRGPEHFACDLCGFVFEIYPKRNADDTTTNTRLGFNVDDVDCLIDLLREVDVTIVSEPTDSEWGRRAVVKDPDGHTVELVTPTNRDALIVKNKAHRTSDTKDAE